MPRKYFVLDASLREQRQQQTMTEQCLGVLETGGPQTSGAGLARGGTQEASPWGAPGSTEGGVGVASISLAPGARQLVQHRKQLQVPARPWGQAGQTGCLSHWGFWHPCPPNTGECTYSLTGDQQ